LTGKFQTKRLKNPEQNCWEVANTDAIISSNGLCASDNTGDWQNVYAKKGFPITGELSRTDSFPGTILYYFEVTNMSTLRFVTFSNNSQQCDHFQVY
jgi:hypothetical protein